MLPKNGIEIELKDGRMMKTIGRIEGDDSRFLACPVDKLHDKENNIHVLTNKDLHPKYF